MTLQQGLDFGASARVHGVDLSHHLSPTHDREVLASMLYCVEDVGEVPGSVGGAYLWHRIRLSDSGAHNVLVHRYRLTPGGPLDRCRIGALA